jgi:hypothetical protein
VLNLLRLPAVLAGLWAGGLFAIGGIAAPAAFALASPGTAGLIAGRMFMQEAYAALLLSLMLFVLLRQRACAAAQQSQGSTFSTDMLLTLAVLFCTVFGYFALQPMMQAGRAGQGWLSFGALHGLSAGMFVVKGLLVLALAWRLSKR